MTGTAIATLPGDPAGIDDAARTVAGQATTVDAVGVRLRHLRATLDQVRSAAGSLAAARLTEASDDTRAAGRLLHGVAGVLTHYSLRLAALQCEERAAADRYADARRRRETYAAALREAPPAGADGSAPWALSALQRRLDDADADATRATSDRTAAAAEQRAEVARAVARLAVLADTRVVRAWALTPGQVVGDLAASRRAGRVAAASVARITELAQRTDDTTLELGRLLRDHGGDPVFWSTFWDTVEPEQLYRALVVMSQDVETLRVADAPRGDAVALLGTLSAGLLAWARSHTASERHDLAHRLTSSLPYGVDAAPAIAVALLGTTPDVASGAGAASGAQARTATADDDRLRADLGVGILAALEEPPEPTPYGFPFRDETTVVLAAAALDALSRDRAAALGFLAPVDPEALSARVRQWLGPRPWQDGGEGVTAAFTAAVRGGTEASSSDAEQARVAQLVSQATTVMPTGLLLSTPLSPAAEASVAHAYLPYIGQFSDFTQRVQFDHTLADVPADQLTADGDRPGTRPDAPLAWGLGTVPQPVQPVLDALSLREVVAGSSRTEKGTAAWFADGMLYTTGHLPHIYPADGSEPVGGLSEGNQAAAAQEIIADVSTLAGFLEYDGLREAEVIDAAAELSIDIGATVVSIGVGKAAGDAVAAMTRTSLKAVGTKAVADLVEVAAGQASARSAAAAGRWSLTAEQDARHAISASEDEMRERIVQPVQDSAVAWSVARGDTPDQAADRWVSLDPDSGTVRSVFRDGYRNSADTRTGDPDHG